MFHHRPFSRSRRRAGASLPTMRESRSEILGPSSLHSKTPGRHVRANAGLSVRSTEGYLSCIRFFFGSLRLLLLLVDSLAERVGAVPCPTIPEDGATTGPSQKTSYGEIIRLEPGGVKSVLEAIARFWPRHAVSFSQACRPKRPWVPLSPCALQGRLGVTGGGASAGYCTQLWRKRCIRQHAPQPCALGLGEGFHPWPGRWPFVAAVCSLERSPGGGIQPQVENVDSGPAWQVRGASAGNGTVPSRAGIVLS